jgi:hypothetical protein
VNTKSAVVIASLNLLATPVFAYEEMAKQLDWTAPLVEAGELAKLGGPDRATDIVAGLEGRWFTLNNTARNWQNEGFRSRLGDSIAQLCGDGWENIVRFEPLGPDSFRIVQASPEGEDQGTFDMTTMDGARTFGAVYDEAYLTSLFEREGSKEDELQRLLGEMKAIMKSGEEIWLPHPDIQVSRSASEVEVWGRCPE